MSLSYIGQQIALYAGYFFVIAGLIGNGINVLVFASVRSYRTTPCTFYFLTASVYNIVYIATVLISRIVISGYGIDLTKTSSGWCKMRQFIGTTVVLCSLTSSCLATVDQFFVTSQSANLRRFSNIKWAHRIVIIVTIVWILHAIPVLVFYDISPVTKSCINTNYAYTIYYPVYLLSLLCAIPAVVMLTFGYLTYRNIQLTRVLAEQRADRQLIRMILVQMVLVLISYIPFGINNAYNLITSNVTKDANRLMNESFALSVFTLVTFIYYAGNCYMFLISSSRFRRSTKDRLLFRRRSSQVTPAQLRSGATIMLDKKTRAGTTTT